MPRNTSPAFSAKIISDDFAMASCVRIERTDGVVQGFTSWDDPFIYGGVLYQSTASLDASMVKQSADQIDNLEVLGILDSDSINSADLRAGRYDDSSITVLLIDPTDLAAGDMILLYGSIGEIEILDNSYKAEIRSLSQRMAQQFGDLTCLTCRAMQLGAPPCAPGGVFGDGKTIEDYRDYAKPVVTRVDSRTLRFATLGRPAGWWNYGMITFELDNTGGLNNGIAREIKRHTVSGGYATLVLQEAFPYPVNSGDLATLEAGCDRLPTTCYTKFHNRVNIQCEPDMIGNDKLTSVGRSS